MTIKEAFDNPAALDEWGICYRFNDGTSSVCHIEQIKYIGPELRVSDYDYSVTFNQQSGISVYGDFAADFELTRFSDFQTE